MSAPEFLSAFSSEFALMLFKECSSSNNDRNTNTFISPLSIMAALCMTYAGAKENTAKEIEEVLKLKNVKAAHETFRDVMKSLMEPKEAVQLNVANRMYMRNGAQVKRKFTSVLEKFYKSEVVTLDFANATKVSNEINEWVEIQTNNKIKNLTSKEMFYDTPDTEMLFVLINAIYFKSDWAEKFVHYWTQPKTFYINENDTITSNFMNQTYCFNFGEDKDNLKCSILELPYVKNEFSMFIVLPNEIDGLMELQSKLTVQALDNLLQTMSPKYIHVSMPKFKLETSLTLSRNLKNLGIKDLFNPHAADLSGISNEEFLHLSTAVHKSFLVVDETGSEAAAATAFRLKGGGGGEIKQFDANHPFIIFIRHNVTKTILFIGCLNNPTEE